MDDAVHASARVDTARSPRGRPTAVAVVSRATVAILGLAAVALAFMLIADQQRFAGQREMIIEEESLALRAIAAMLENDLERVVEHTASVGAAPPILRFLTHPSEMTRANVEHELVAVATYSAIYEDIWLIGEDGDVIVHVVYNRGQPIAAAPEAAPRDLNDALAEVRRSGHSYVGPLTDAENVDRRDILIGIGLGVEQSNILVARVPVESLLEQLRLSAVERHSELLLVNERGAVYTPIAATDAAIEAFMMDREELWDQIVATDSGFVNAENVFIFTTLDTQPNSVPLHEWKMVAWIPPEVYRYEPFETVGLPPLVAGPLMLVIGGIGLLIGWLRASDVARAQALAESEQRLTLALEGADEGLLDVDVLGGEPLLSPRINRMLGEDPERHLTLPELLERLHPQDREQVHREMGGELGSTHRFSGRYRMRHRDGHYVWIAARGWTLTDRNGQTVRLVGTAHDVSEDVAREEKLRQAAVVFENTREAIVIMDEEGRVSAVNNAFATITGFSREEVLGRGRRLLLNPEQEHMLTSMDRKLAEEGYWRGELQARRKDGEVFPLLADVSVVDSPYTGGREFVAVLTEISALKTSQERLNRLAHYDALTGLPNRLLFNATLEQALHRARRHRQRLALLFLDLDRFKEVNDRLGHAAGDELLRAVATRLRDSVRTEDTVARLAGDEFVVILEELDAPGAAAAPAEKILDAIRQPLRLKGETHYPSASLGISIFPDDAETGEQLLNAADAAMYNAKHDGHGRVAFFTAAITADADRRLALEEGLRRALQDFSLAVVYQPEISLPGMRLSGAEALLRWRHPEHGWLHAADFLDVAEDSGLIEPIGEWLSDTVCRDLLAWQRSGLSTVRVSLNLSARQLTRPSFLRSLYDIFSRHDLPNEQIPLAVEASGEAFSEADEAGLAALRERGISLTLDRFGSDRTALNELARLPVETIKIDRALTARLSHDTYAQAVLHATVALAHHLQIGVNAQGIQHLAQLRWARRMGLRCVQGELLREPLEADEFADLLRTPKARLRLRRTPPTGRPQRRSVSP